MIAACNRFAKVAKLVAKQSAMRIQVHKLSDEIRELLNQQRYGCTTQTNDSITLTVQLSDYLSLFPDVSPVANTFEQTEGCQSYSRLHYPPQLLPVESNGKKVLIEAWSEKFYVSAPQAIAA